MIAPHPPQTLFTMLGIGRRSFRIAVAGVIVAYVFIEIVLPRLDRTPVATVVSILGSIGLAACLWLAARGDDDPIGVGIANLVVALGAVSAGAVWWSLPPGSINWVRPGSAYVVYAVAIALLAVRGRIRWAWCAFGLVAATALVAIAWWGWGGGIGGQILVRMAAALVPVTLMMVVLRPLLRVARVLDQREIESVAANAAHAATLRQRRRQLAELDGDVRPILERIAAGEHLTEADAQAARLVMHSVRDNIRGAGWMSPQVRADVARARARGVDVRLFDDRGDGTTQFDMAQVRTELSRTLEATTAGAVTARLLPTGREYVAVIAVRDHDLVARVHCRPSGNGLVWESETGDAPST